MTASTLRHGDYTGLAENYAAYRPGYCEGVLDALIGLLGRPTATLDAVDAGAGTGIWTRFLCHRGFRHLTAIEPNEDMRRAGQRDSAGLPIEWRRGTGEATCLDAECCDLVSMASSFHWVDFESGSREFHRILRPRGRFVALWNPRLIEANPLLIEIEGMLTSRMQPGTRRISSGRSGLTETLFERLDTSPWFEDVLYLEGRHVLRQTPAQYLGVWKSVNDVRVQLGPAGFAEFMAGVERRISGLDAIETTYLTRAWTARRKD